MTKENPEKVKTEVEPVKIITPQERKRILIEGIKKTVVPVFVGFIFALLFVIMNDKVSGKPWYSVLLLVGLISYGIQKLIYPYLGVRVNEFGIKDWLYVEFMTIIFLMVFWILLLNK